MSALSGSACGLWVLGGTIALLALFWLLRGRIRIDRGWAGFNIVRFSRFERLVHWLLALSFVVLALTGLGMRYRTPLLVPLLGEQGFAEVLRMHALMGIPFLASLLLAFLLWVRHSLPHWRDVVWLFKGGGMIVRGWHPPAWKFNAGQKLLFWLVITGGAWLSFSGLMLLLPHDPIPGYEAYRTAWHSVPALVLTCAVIVHIYIRTAGVQGAASAMASGEVDANWARQHHSLWADQEMRRIEDSAEPAAGETVASPTQ